MKNIFFSYIKKIKIKQLEKFLKFLFPDFIERDDCIFIKDDDNYLRYSLNNFHDKTDMESFINHFHIKDLLHKKIDNNLILFLGETWKVKLKMTFPEKKFIIYIINSEIIRFHQIRENEALWFDINDEKEIKNNSIIYIGINLQSFA